MKAETVWLNAKLTTLKEDSAQMKTALKTRALDSSGSACVGPGQAHGVARRAALARGGVPRKAVQPFAQTGSVPEQ